ncbi:uncharacterized protein LOC117895636 isoform X1 [Drosophila subobscura]|uniref:uncharacterized protein LOC117895636 isoform X1 n=2 Tax=Drosophila subobscura TaxID=7241 RepID=UPI00155B0C59|nr:uncharacterized protein LOC117895636 isoform X1 [Drosophila subobscura]XP_034659287.1 uncharacterized protein LOC117895636 isoform X1 [Drosophila subobscura]XP_034659288.1 uncharacterized protein LOC117895636 isoform X1 [Drosophila subobscura]
MSASRNMQFVEINPTNTYLSGEQLIKHRHLEIEAPCGGPKRTQNEGSAAELEEITAALANLRAQLSVPRIERLGGRALATWDKEQQAAEILRKDGKFESFGYSVQGKQYLEYYEALFLLELGRLQLEYHGVTVSVEQAYVLLLGEQESEKYSNYLVYSIMSRAGYIVVRHKRHQPTAEAVTRADCIWALLDERIGNIPIAGHIRASPMYAPVEKGMEEMKQLIMWPNMEDNENSSEPIDFKFDTRKRKSNTASKGDPGSKKAYILTSKSLIDLPKTETTFSRFKSVFNKFDIVQLKSSDYPYDDDTLPSLNISFDLHLHNEGFKKRTPKTPTFNVMILPPDALFPTHSEVAQCQRQQRHTAPLLVVSVSESKQIQAFLYYIS